MPLGSHSASGVASAVFSRSVPSVSRPSSPSMPDATTCMPAIVPSIRRSDRPPASTTASTEMPCAIGAGQCRLADAQAQFGIEAGRQPGKLAQPGEARRQPRVQRHLLQRQVGGDRRRLAPLEVDAAGRSARHRRSRRVAEARSRRRSPRRVPTMSPVAARRPAGLPPDRAATRQAPRPAASARSRAATGASSLASPSNRVCAGSARATRPVRCSLPLPGNSALASRTVSVLPVSSKAARTCSRVPPPSGADSAEKSIPIGRSMPAIVVPARSSTGSQASRSSRLADSAMSSRCCGATRKATAPLRRRAADLEREIVDRRQAAADRQPAVGAERHRRRRQQHRQVRDRGC